MSFPSIEQYIDALQIPQHTLLDPRLAAGRVEATSMGLPFGRSGQFALTFKIFADGRAFAFRCFQTERASMQRRYSAISAAVRAAGLPYFVTFEYLDSGIRVQQQNYPALSMDWAQGPPLGVYVEQHYKEAGRLRAVLQQLHGMALALEGAGIAHGDIQTGNILVGPSGELKLVDYDGMYVPALTSLGAIETGHPNFQHPQRARLKPFDATLDRYSFALLHATLSALIESPSLWTTLQSDPEALLLRASDLADPMTSEAFRVLTRLPGSGPIFSRLLAVTSAEYTQTPAFGDFLAGRNIPPMAFQPNAAATPAAVGATDAPMSQPQKLAQLYSQGVLSDAEFAAAQAKDTRTAQLQKLAQLHSQGVLSDAEFAAALAKDFDGSAALLVGLSSGATGSPPRTPASTPIRPSGATYMTPQPSSRPSPHSWEPWQTVTLLAVGAAIALLAVVLIVAGLTAATVSSDPLPGEDTTTSFTPPSDTTTPSSEPDPTPAATGSLDPLYPTIVDVCWKRSGEVQSCNSNDSTDPASPFYSSGPATWAYGACWPTPDKIRLQRYVSGQWDTVLETRGVRDEASCIDKDFPYSVDVSYTETVPGRYTYRFVGDGVTDRFAVNAKVATADYWTCSTIRFQDGPVANCDAGLQWTGTGCWPTMSVFLEKKVRGSWVKSGKITAARDLQECSASAPYAVDFSGRESAPGKFNYRIRTAQGAQDAVTVTVTVPTR